MNLYLYRGLWKWKNAESWGIVVRFSDLASD